MNTHQYANVQEAVAARKEAQHWPWAPAQFPWRVTYAKAGSYHSRYISMAFTFSTEEEARAFMKANFSIEPKGCTGRLDLAQNTDSWAKHGSWKRIATAKA